MDGGKMLLQTMVIIATCFISNTMSLSNSLLQTVVDRNRVAYSAVSANQMISGTNGHCIDVHSYVYTDGNPIIIWPCKDFSHPILWNQLWTFQSDGTLRSNGSCLTTSGYSQGSNIVIHNCETAEKSATTWELRSDGEIVNSASGLVVTGLYGEIGTQLTLQKSISSSFQTWRVDNNTRPRLAAIVGMNGLCLQVTENVVWLDECENINVGQQWLLYPDGTIRPQGSELDCLGFDDLINSQIVAFTCGHGSASQRWLFTDKGTILNERANLVFDVAHSDPSYKKIIVFPGTGKPNQRWELLYLSSSNII